MLSISSDKSIIALNLISPPASQTDKSIALLWDKPRRASNIVTYHIYIDGKLHGSSTTTDYTAMDLAHGQGYEVFVRSVLADGRVSEKSNVIKVFTKAQSVIFDITSFGAIGDGKTINTKAIQKAIDSCSVGGKVYVKKGIFLTGALYLKSNMTLYLEEDGVLLGSQETKDYPLMRYRFEGIETTCYSSLINTNNFSDERLENITIEGLGKIDASGSTLRKNELAENKGKPGRAICLRSVDHIYLKDITVRQSPAWCVHLIYSNHVSINNIKIHSKYDESGRRYEGIENGDGLNPDSCRSVYIFNSMISSQDDCIAIKSGRDAEGREISISSENIRITNCSFKSGFGIAVGSEMSGSVRNVLVQDCDFNGVYSISSIKAPRGRGGCVENIRYEDITFKYHSNELRDTKWFRGAIYIDQFYGHETFNLADKEKITDETPIIRNIYFKNIELDTIASSAIYLTGLPECPLENIQLKHIKALGKYGMNANNIKGLVLQDVSVNEGEDEAFIFYNVE